jgi:tetratricopeptide (TPR) repeat protein
LAKRAAFFAVICACASARAEPIVRYGVDAQEVASIAATHPKAAAKLMEGEALLETPSTPNIEKAARLFGEAAEDERASGLLYRRQCQALAALGRHQEAVAACEKSLSVDYRSVYGMRAMVGALMSGSSPPTSKEVAEALIHAHRAYQVAPDEPAGFAGRCDIAEKIGDMEMLNACIVDLERVAPEHYETVRAKAIAASLRPGWGLVAGWLGLALACLGTLGHAILKRPRRRTASATVASVLAVLLFQAPPARAAEGGSEAAPAPAAGSPAEPEVPVAGHLSKFKIDDKDPSSSVPTAEQRDHDPLEYGYFIMDLGDHAEWAIAKGDHLAAAGFYRALARAVPDTAVGFVKACEQYDFAGDRDKAQEFCAAALTLKGVTVTDYSRYARLALKRKNLRPADISNLDGVIKHLEADPATRSVGLDIECTLGAREGDQVRLQHCVPQLTAIDSKNPKTLFYQWALAIKKKDFEAAERILIRTKEWAGAPPGQLQQMEQVTLEAMPAWRKSLRSFRDWRVGASFALVIVTGLALALLKKRPMPTPTRSGPVT